MTAVEKIEELARQLEAEQILTFLQECKEEGYDLEQAIAELRFVIKKQTVNTYFEGDTLPLILSKF